ncbi:MAG: hypothetical protein CL876_02945 [Dehalococcoidales bacterium]|nr:hypothetical protein [Dehalococcoidales bacterium]
MNQATGLVFRKSDLHVHTSESTCYRDRSVTDEQIVDAALSTALEVVGITDHNSVASLDDIRHIAGEKGLFVFPGIELTTRSGHVVALFELDTPVDKLEDFLDSVEADPEGRGDGGAIIGNSMEEVFQKIAEWGGLAIAAHIDRWPIGFLETNEPRQVKMSIHANKDLSALEITVPEKKGLWNGGQVRDYPKKYACIQASDAHSLNDIGRRPVYIQMDEVSLSSLNLAFLEHETRIVFPDEYSETK